MFSWTRLKSVFSRFAGPFAKTREYVPLIAGLLLTLAALFVARQRITSIEKDLRGKTAPVEIVVASRAIPKGTPLSENNLAKLSVPSSGTSRRNVPAGEFALLLGGRAKSDVEPGEPILWTDVEEPFDIDRLSEAIPPGRRALTLEADLAASFSGLIRPGDRVDIFCPDPGGKAPGTWLDNIPVIAVDRQFKGPADSEASADASAITVSVTPRDGRRLVSARDAGLRWFLRNPAERSRPASSSARPSERSRAVEIWRAGVPEWLTRTAAIEFGQ